MTSFGALASNDKTVITQELTRHVFSMFAVIVFCLAVSACTQAPRTATASEVTSAAQPVAPQKIPCPVKLIKARMVHNSEEDVYVTVLNISDSDITAIAFGAAHTDKFGVTRTPYKTQLTSEDTIKRGHSQSMHWEVLMEELFATGGKPGSSELYVSKVAFADGRIVNILGIEGCSFKF